MHLVFLAEAQFVLSKQLIVDLTHRFEQKFAVIL